MLGPKDFHDQWGLLDKKAGPDGGDSGQREGMYWSLLGMIERNSGGVVSDRWERPTTYEVVMKKINPHPSVILRHSFHGYDASDWDRMSRDQFQPNVIAAGYWSKERLNGIRKAHWKRAFIFTSNTRRNGATAQNHGKEHAGEVRDYSAKLPDFTGPEIWGNFIRSAQAWWFFPFLVIYDLELFFGCIKWRYFPSHNITMNQLTSMLQGIDRLPTVLSFAGSRIMPPERMADLAQQHFNDFDNQSTPQPEDMEFFGEMFKEAYRKIKPNYWWIALSAVQWGVMGYFIYRWLF